MTTNEQSPTSATSEHEAAIRGLFDRLLDAWDRGDARAYAALFTEDSDYVAFDGSRLRGRAQNAALHRHLFDTVLHGTRLRGEIESVRFVTPDVAIVHAVGAVLMPWQREIAPRRRSRSTMVVVRHDGVWQIEAFHNTRIRPLPEMKEGSFALRMFRLWARLRMALSHRGR